MATFLIPYTTPANYTYDSDKVEVAGGLGKLANLGIKGITFDGIDDNVAVTDSPIFDLSGNDFAFSCLVIPAAAVAQAIIAKDNTSSQRQFQIAILADGRGQIAYWKNGSIIVLQTTLASQFSTGVFAHAIFQKRSGAFQIYINGLLVSLGSLTGVHGNMQSTSADIYIGAGFPGVVHFNGWISRVSVHSQSFSAAEAATFYSEIISLDSSLINFLSQIVYWPMDDGADGTSADGDIVGDPLNGNDNHGHGDDGGNNTGLTWDNILSIMRYDSVGPSIYKTAGDSDIGLISWTNFSETLGGGNEGSVAHQLSEDGITWKYWDGGAWVVATTEYNIASVISSNIASFSVASQSIYVKSFLISDGTQKVEIDLIQIGYTTNINPTVDAGTNKFTNSGETIRPFSDCSFSDPDGTVDNAYYKIDGEVDVWTEILQGVYATLQEAVQAFLYQFLNAGTLTARLQVKDNGGLTAEDSLTVTVSKFLVTFSVKDEDSNPLNHVTFNADDGTGDHTEDSPFTYGFDFGQHHVVFSKPGFVSHELDINVLISGQSYDVVLYGQFSTNDIDALATALHTKVRPAILELIVDKPKQIDLSVAEQGSIDVDIINDTFSIEVDITDEDATIEIEITEEDPTIEVAVIKGG